MKDVFAIAASYLHYLRVSSGRFPVLAFVLIVINNNMLELGVITEVLSMYKF